MAGVSRTSSVCPAANLIYQRLKATGHEVLAVNPHMQTFEGDPCYPSVSPFPAASAPADVSRIRGTDSSGVIDTLLARRLIADDARFGGRGRPAFLVTTDRFLQLFGIGSLAELPPRPYLA